MIYVIDDPPRVLVDLIYAVLRSTRGYIDLLEYWLRRWSTCGLIYWQTTLLKPLRVPIMMETDYWKFLPAGFYLRDFGPTIRVSRQKHFEIEFKEPFWPHDATYALIYHHIRSTIISSGSFQKRDRERVVRVEVQANNGRKRVYWENGDA